MSGHWQDGDGVRVGGQRGGRGGVGVEGTARRGARVLVGVSIFGLPFMDCSIIRTVLIKLGGQVIFVPGVQTTTPLNKILNDASLSLYSIQS